MCKWSLPTFASLLEIFVVVQQALIHSASAWYWRPGCRSAMLWMLLVGKDPRGICWDSLGTSASSWLPLLNLTFPVFSWRLELSDLSALSALPPHPFHSFRSLAICLGCASLVVVKDCRTLFSPEKLHSCQKSPPALSRRRRTWCQGTCICSTKQDELCMLGCVVRQFRWDDMPEMRLWFIKIYLVSHQKIEGPKPQPLRGLQNLFPSFGYPYHERHQGGDGYWGGDHHNDSHVK